MAATVSHQQVTWSSGNTGSLSSGSSLASDAMTPPTNHVGGTLMAKADNTGSPASGDLVHVYIAVSTGDPDAEADSGDEFPGNARGMFLGTLDTNDTDPDIRSFPLPFSFCKSYKVTMVSEAASNTHTVSSQITWGIASQMATEFPISHPWPYKPPSSIQLDYSGRLMNSLFFLADGRAGAGAVLRDFSQNGNHATLYGDASRNPDGSINYSGANSRAARPGSTGLMNFLHANNQQGTISLWLKLDSSTSNSLSILFSTLDSGGDVGVRFSLDDRSSTNNKLSFITSNGSSTMTALSANDAIQDTDWHHVCATIDNTVSASAQNVEIFVDGASVATGTKSITPSTSDHDQSLHIGNRNSLDFPTQGDMDNVEIYQKALSSKEVLWLSQNRWHAYMPMMSFISSTDSVPGTAHPHYYMRRRYCA